jgi:hypothetical protein
LALHGVKDPERGRGARRDAALLEAWAAVVGAATGALALGLRSGGSKQNTPGRYVGCEAQVDQGYQDQRDRHDHCGPSRAC